MPNPYCEITKRILIALFETGRYAFTGESPILGVTRWRTRVPYPSYIKNKEEQKGFSQALWRLKKSRLIILKEQKKRKFVIELTENGKRKIQEIQFKDLTIQKVAKWDGLWRIVIFDIPEKIKWVRQVLRKKLQEWNFYQLQKSVWVCPYPCEKEIGILVGLFDISPYVNIVKAAEIKNDGELRRHFHLL